MTILIAPRVPSEFASSDPTPCLEWPGKRTSGGYGYFWEGRTVLAHRRAYEEAYGPIPAGLQIDHLCRVRHCVNPSHLEAVSRRENILRGESPVARQARQTHCKRGHELSSENVYVRLNMRFCRPCRRARDKIRGHRRGPGTCQSS